MGNWNIWDEDDYIDDAEEMLFDGLAALERHVKNEHVSKDRAMQCLEELRAYTNVQIARLGGNRGPAYASEESKLYNGE